MILEVSNHLMWGKQYGQISIIGFQWVAKNIRRWLNMYNFISGYITYNQIWPNLGGTMPSFFNIFKAVCFFVQFCGFQSLALHTPPYHFWGQIYT
jgi:hypothetical protein